jgi:hypothetical protein
MREINTRDRSFIYIIYVFSEIRVNYVLGFCAGTATEEGIRTES